MSNSNSWLEVDSLCAGYGESRILDQVSFSLAEGQSLALLGRNGVGKSTLLLSLMGLNTHQGGHVSWQGQPLLNKETHQRAALGIGWVPQERYMFPSLTVEEHLTVIQRPGRWDLHSIYQLFPRLEERSQNMGNQLSGGEQQMVAIARALMLNPTLLLLDEPMEGLAPIIVQELLAVIKRLIEEEGLSVIMVEQHARMTLSITEHALILDRGQTVYYGDSAPLLANPESLEQFVF